MKKRGVIKRESETHVSLEEEEVVREYFKTEKIYFGVSTLRPGAVGGLDTGHSEADEVFFCMTGHVLCYFPEDDTYYELFAGDALLIPPDTGHKLFNIGEELATVVFSCAPHP